MEYASKVCCQGEYKEEDDKRLLKFPEAFVKETSWKTFKKVIKSYLGTKKEINWIPLEYMMCKIDGMGQVRKEYAMKHKHHVVTTPLEGKAYQADK